MKPVFWVLNSFLVFFLFDSFAQQQRFTDSLEAYDGLLGKAEFDFIRRNNVTIKNGEFTYFYNDQDSIDEAYTRKILVQGNYKNALKSGEWSFVNKRFRPTSTPIVDGYSVIHKSAGVEHAVRVPFVDGSALGAGLVVTNQIENSQLSKNLFTARANFENNIFVGKFEAFSDSIRISGEIDEDGLFASTWTFEHFNGEKIIEKRSFEKGVLIGHEIIRNGKTFEIQHVGLSKNPEDEGEWVLINADIHYFNILLRTNMGKRAEDKNKLLTDSIIMQSNLFLKYGLTSFREFDGLNLWRIDGDETHLFLPKLRVRKFPYTDEERSLIAKARAQIQESRAIIKDYLRDPQVELNKHAYRELALYYEIYTEYRDELLKLERVFDLLNLPSYEFINREEIMPYIFEGISYPEQVTFTYQDNESSEIVEFPANIKVEDATIRRLAEHSEEILRGLQSKLDQVKPIIERNRKRFEIVDKERELLQKRDTIKHLFTNANKDEKFNKFHQRYAQIFITKSDEIFVNYAKQEIEQRIELTDATLTCLQGFVDAYIALIKLENKIERLEEVYTRVVWNPFTFTDMTELVKERVYNAYYLDVLPFLLGDLEQHVDCDKILSGVENFEKLYDRMRELREMDTRELERSLRRVRDPRKVIELFDLKLDLN